MDLILQNIFILHVLTANIYWADGLARNNILIAGLKEG